MGIVKTTVYIRLVAKPFYGHKLMPSLDGWGQKEGKENTVRYRCAL
jgi:hypothetical protein